MTKLTIVADVHAKKDKIDFVKAELLKLVPVTREEKGCINYDLYQDDENPAHFTFYENWESSDLFEAHMKSPSLAAFMEATDGAVEFTISKMTQIS
ncbi:antibiotic biosynthesis monooxygenase [Rhodobacteraceae bacterium 63075]|nr:antibiotic biosynthesis monooxygenase [Rhodobacteraceae bacterium 63075]